MYRIRDETPEILLVHPGGPFWARKDKGAWTIPKGEPQEEEALLLAAQREFTEETGFATQGPFHELGSVKQAGGKVVTAWAFEGDCDPELLKSNTCKIEWPPRSKQFLEIPEVDRGRWFTLPEAEESLLPGQRPLLEALRNVLLGSVSATEEAR